MRSRVFGNSVPNNGCLPGWAGLAENPTGRLLAGGLIACAAVCWLSTAARPSLAAETAAKKQANADADAKEQEETLEKYTKGVIWSLYLGRDWVYALTPSGIYRASPREKKWQHLPSPQWLPQVVLFATQPESLRQVYAYCPVPRVGSYYEGFSATGKTLGLYRFDTRDNEWKVVSTQYDFVDVYVADDKAMFSIVMVSGVSKDNNQPYVTAGFGFKRFGRPLEGHFELGRIVPISRPYSAGPGP